MNKLFITIFAASLLLFGGSNAGAQPARAMVSDTAIRGEANLGSTIIATLRKGDLVHVVDLQGDWYRVIVPNEQGTPRTGFVPARLIEIVSVHETPTLLYEPPILLEEPPMVLQPPTLVQEPPPPFQEPPQFLMGPALRAALPIPQGPPIAPTLAYIMQHRAEAAEHERNLQALALERDIALQHEQELRSEVDALRADPNSVQTPRPNRQIRSDQSSRPKTLFPQAREGFWFNAGLGFGSYSCETCLERISGGSGGISLGGTINERVLLGGGTAGYYRSFDSGTALTVGTVDARVRFYPIRASGFFATGGMGVGTVSIGTVGFRTTGSGVAAVLGVGWDIPIRDNLSFTPFWNGIGVNTSIYRAGFSQLGVGITIH